MDGDSSYRVFLSGALSGVVEGISVQPFEFLKTRAQLSSNKHQSMLSLAREALRW
jgi:solute carrier family 25 2-oxodicarboxylate transporter 21